MEHAFEILFVHSIMYRRYQKLSEKCRHRDTLKVALRVVESFDSIDDVTEVANNDKDIEFMLRDVYCNREKKEEELNQMNKAHKSKVKRKQQMDTQMKLFLLHVLPVALWKRELDKSLDPLEEALLMELIPHTCSHYLWDEITEMVTRQMLRINQGRCRHCGNTKVERICSDCKKAHFCSGKCQRQSMEQKAYGHYDLECDYLSH